MVPELERRLQTSRKNPWLLPGLFLAVVLLSLAVFGIVLAGQARQQPIAVARELVCNADADGVIAFPGVVPDEARQQPDGDQDQQR